MKKSLALDFGKFNSDSYPQAATALHLSNTGKTHETPVHTHQKCQLVIPLHGIVKCRVDNAIWMVPVNSAIWIPSHMPHSNQISPSTKVCMLFIDPNEIDMPNNAFTLSISLLIKELVLYLTTQNQHYSRNDQTSQLVEVLLHQITTMEREKFYFSIPQEKRLNELAHHLLINPNDRKTITEWAANYSMSERTFTRLVKKNVGTTFGRWRGQLHLILALQMLGEDESVQRVADKLGYESVSAFISFFRKALGTSPKKYIKELNKY